MSKKVFREFFNHLQSSSTGKENFEGTDRTPQNMAIDGKPSKPEQKFNKMKCVKETSFIAKINNFAEEFAPESKENNLKKMSERQTPTLLELLDRNQQNQPPANTFQKTNSSAVLSGEKTKHLVNQFEQLIDEFETFVNNHHLPSAE